MKRESIAYGEVTLHSASDDGATGLDDTIVLDFLVNRPI